LPGGFLTLGIQPCGLDALRFLPSRLLASCNLPSSFLSLGLQPRSLDALGFQP